MTSQPGFPGHLARRLARARGHACRSCDMPAAMCICEMPGPGYDAQTRKPTTALGVELEMCEEAAAHWQDLARRRHAFPGLALLVAVSALTFVAGVLVGAIR